MRLWMAAALVVLVAPCDKSNSGGSSVVSQPNGSSTVTTINLAMPNQVHRAPGSPSGKCGPGSNVDVDRMLTGTATATLGDLGPTQALPDKVQDLGATMPDAKYTWSNRPANIDCNPTGPTVGPFTATANLNYRSQVDQQPNAATSCVWKSRMDIASFNVTGNQTVDDMIKNQIKDEAHKNVDALAADVVNRVAHSAAFPSGTDPRCGDWSELPMM